MAINPMKLMKLKERFGIFRTEHPKVVPFFKTLRDKALEEGTILEMRVKTKDGEEFVSNIRLTENDVETLGTFLK